jgi:hypothetical protein
MSSTDDSSAYNYAVFHGEEDWDSFQSRLHAGEKAPDATLSDLDGNAVSLSSLWRANHVMIEFGSYT